jgi:MFS family permease
MTGSSTSTSRHRWVAVAVFFLFMLFHQTDQNVIGPLTSTIMGEFDVTKTQWGALRTGALLVGAVFYPLWGYLYDRYARARLLALASFLWGLTTMLNTVARSFPAFWATRAATGIDDSSYPGLYSIIADYFGPRLRGKIYGVLQLTTPVGYLLGMVLALTLGEEGQLGWRSVFYITGGLGVLCAMLIFFGVREPVRGQSEPELEGLAEIGSHKFDLATAKSLFRKPSLVLLFVQGFFGVFPWNVIGAWIFVYLEESRVYNNDDILSLMGVVIVILSAGYFIGGAAGDALFRHTPRGRLLVSSTAVLLGAVFLFRALNVPVENRTLFFVMLSLTAFFMPIAGPNVVSSVYDITLPEVRSTALAVQMFSESIGAATAPFIAGVIADAYLGDLKPAFLWICTTTWMLCAIFYAVSAYLVPRDIAVLRAQLQQRADQEQSGQPAVAS